MTPLLPRNRVIFAGMCVLRLCSIAGQFGTVSCQELAPEPAGDSPSDVPFVFVTAASENHACPLLEMLQSLLGQAPRTRVVGKENLH